MSDFSAGMLVGAMTSGKERHAEDILEGKGGLFIDEETLGLAGKMEDVANYCHTSFQQFSAALLTVVRTATDDGDDPIQAIEAWVNACLAGVHIA